MTDKMSVGLVGGKGRTITGTISAVVQTETGYIMALPDGGLAVFNEYGECVANDSQVYSPTNLTFEEVFNAEVGVVA